MASSDDALKLDFVTVDVFTKTKYYGNPLAVVFVPARFRASVTQEAKERIAREFNLSETVFLHTEDAEPDTGSKTRAIDIFTTEEELPFAGHPTIGSAYVVLNHLGWSHVDTLLTKSGPIRIAPTAGAPGSVKASIAHAVHVHGQTLRDLYDKAPSEMEKLVGSALSDDPEIRDAEMDGRFVSIVRGLTFLLTELPSLGHLARVTTEKRLNFAAIPDLLDKGEWEKGFVSRYYFVRGAPSTEGEDELVHGLRTRMIELGFEDPATGSAACALASYCTIKDKLTDGARFAITQGVEIGRESRISVEVVPGEMTGGHLSIKHVLLGGTAVQVMSGTVSV